jgi:hypothetical protein
VCVKGVLPTTMQMEMKDLRLRTPVELGSRFDDWEVSWLGGWSRHRMHYLVMVIRIRAEEKIDLKEETPLSVVVRRR